MCRTPLWRLLIDNSLFVPKSHILQCWASPLFYCRPSSLKTDLEMKSYFSLKNFNYLDCCIPYRFRYMLCWRFERCLQHAPFCFHYLLDLKFSMKMQWSRLTLLKYRLGPFAPDRYCSVSLSLSYAFCLSWILQCTQWKSWKLTAHFGASPGLNRCRRVFLDCVQHFVGNEHNMSSWNSLTIDEKYFAMKSFKVISLLRRSCLALTRDGILLHDSSSPYGTLRWFWLPPCRSVVHFPSFTNVSKPISVCFC